MNHLIYMNSKIEIYKNKNKQKSIKKPQTPVSIECTPLLTALRSSNTEVNVKHENYFETTGLFRIT